MINVGEWKNKAILELVDNLRFRLRFRLSAILFKKPSPLKLILSEQSDKHPAAPT
jgi:hypothetical protein